MTLKRKILLALLLIFSFPILGSVLFLFNNPVLVKSFLRRYVSPSIMDDISKYILPYREIKLLEKTNTILGGLEDYGVENDIKIKNSLIDLTFEKSEEKKLKVQN